VGLGRAVQVGLLPRSDQPFEAWAEPRLERGLRAVVSAGVLAANPHNSQPWKFRVGMDTIDVHLDPGRALGPVDPFLRQMHIGVGCALENLVVGATSQGLSGNAALFPNPSDATLAARLVLTSVNAPPSNHVAMISQRHTNRGPYDPARLSPLIEQALLGQRRHDDTTLAIFDSSSAKGSAFSEAILTSTERLIEDDEFMLATDAWFRWTPREVDAHRDGPSLDCAGLSTVTRIAAQLGPRPSEDSFRSSWLDSTREVHLATAAAFGVISVRDPVRPSQLVEAGRLWQRVHLEATRHGVAMQPLDQWLELVDRAKQLGLSVPVASGVALASPGYTPVLMFRAGMPLRDAGPSARRPLEEVILT